MSELLIYINRRSGVAHSDFWCPAIAEVPTECLRVEAFDPDRPRRKCSLCWNGGCPRRSAFAGAAMPVSERSEGNPRSGLTGVDVAATSCDVEGSRELRTAPRSVVITEVRRSLVGEPFPLPALNDEGYKGHPEEACAKPI